MQYKIDVVCDVKIDIFVAFIVGLRATVYLVFLFVISINL